MTREQREPGFHRSDLKPCGICGKGVMHAGNPFFYRVRVEMLVVDIGAVRRAAGLEQVFGGGSAGAALAAAMGPDDPIAGQLSPALAALLCQDCAMEGAIVPRLCERSAEDAEAPR